MELELGLLGPFEARGPGGALKLGSRKERALLALLALAAGDYVSREALVEELWSDDDPPTTAAATLRGLVSRLRRTLGEANGEALLARSPGRGYRLDVTHEHVDALRFEHLVREARRAGDGGATELAAQHLEAALLLWRGPPLREFADYAFAVSEATRFEELCLEANEELVEARLSLGQTVEAVSLVRSHVEEHPYRERAWGQLMVGLYRLGRQAEALRAFQKLRGILRERLGVEPSPALRDLERQLLLQSPELEPSLHSTSSSTERAVGRPVLPGGNASESRVGIRVLLLGAFDTPAHGPATATHQGSSLTEHATLARIVSEAGGIHVGPAGARVEAVFPTVALAVQAGLNMLIWPLEQAGVETPSPSPVADEPGPPAPIKGLPRLVIHVGEVVIATQGCAGTAADQAQLLVDAASPGQLLLTGAAAELAASSLDSALSLRDLGEYFLGQDRRPQRLYQVVHRQLPELLAPLRLPGPSRHNLPSRLGHFEGRQRELTEVARLVRARRLVTLTGVGGVGKTRLAIEVARRLLTEFPDGVFFVELGPLSDPDLVGDQLLASLDIRVAPPATDGAEEGLCLHLARRASLLVIDGCEHLIDDVAPIVDRVLGRCPRVTVLATSREPLRIPDELIWSVPPLSLPPAAARHPEELAGSDAVSFFCERAKEAELGFELNPQNAPLVVQVCRRLDGIPLALELAAARLRVLSLEQVAQRLDERFRLLSGGTRRAIDRHRTLKATMDWSYKLLSSQEQLVLRRLSVFPASFDLAAAERVVGEDACPTSSKVDVLSDLDSLIDKSLLVVESQEREKHYRLLETVREYAEEHLAEANETQLARSRHAEYFLELVRRYWDADPRADTGRWLRRFHVEHDNLRAALGWFLLSGPIDACLEIAGALRIYWLFAGHFPEACHWYEQALARSTGQPTPARVAALNGFGLVLLQRGGRGPAEELHREALESALHIDDHLGAALARFHLGLLAVQDGDSEVAERLLEEASAAFQRGGWAASAAWCQFPLGWAALGRSDHPGAEAAFAVVLDVGRRNASDDLVAHALSALAPLAALGGNSAQAERYALEAVEVARALGLNEILAMTLVRAAEVAVLLGRVDQADSFLREALTLFRQMGGRGWVADCFELLAFAREHQGHLRQAARLLGACEALRDSLGERVGEERWSFAEAKQCTSRIVAAIGQGRFRQELDRGRQMSLQDAFSDALGDSPPVSRRAHGQR